MDDFTVMLDNLPDDKFFNGDEDVLRLYLWNHCETIMQEQAMRHGAVYQHQLDSTLFQISDIQFARNTSNETAILDKYVKKKKEIVLEEHRNKSYDGNKKSKSEDKINKLITQLDKIKQEFINKTDRGHKLKSKI